MTESACCIQTLQFILIIIFQMSLKDNLKILMIAWGIPMLIVITGVLATPSPHLSREAFPLAEFTPAGVEIVTKKDRKGRDSFELWLKNPSGEAYFIRNPEPEPIHDLSKKVPRETPLKVRYDPRMEGNVLMEIAAVSSADSILSFDEVMKEYASRRRLVCIIAGIWFVIGSLAWIGLRWA